MAVLPYLALGLTALNMLKPKPKTGMVDPRKFQQAFRYSPQELAALKRASLADIQSNVDMLNTRNIAAIRQAGAARRMPSGAIASGIAGATYQSGRLAAEAMPQINAQNIQLKKQGEMNYFNALNQFQMGQAQAQNMGQNNIWATLGSLGKIALLWQAGLLGQPQGNVATGNQGVSFYSQFGNKPF